MGKIEDILWGMKPLQECHHDIVTYYIACDKFDILRYPDYFKGWNGKFSLLFHTDETKALRLFFHVSEEHNPRACWDQGINHKEFVRNLSLFSGENLFRYLHIPYPDLQKDPIQDMYTLSRAIHANFSCINNAFSKENIQTTCLVLQKTERGNLDEIKRAFEDALGFE